MNDFTHELQVARQVAQEALTLVRDFASRPLQVEHKDGGEPVTAADRAASELIVDRLRQAFPADGILSEELPDDGSRLRRSRVWMIDPIDGTRDFVRGATGYAVMIGLCLFGRPVLGVVAQPATGFTWSGVVGQGAWKDHHDGRREVVRPSDLSQLEGVRIVRSQSRRLPELDRYHAALGVTDELSIGSVGIKMALVAEGSRELYIYPGHHLKLWDSCGPEAILVAAGGRVTDIDGRELAYTAALSHPRGIVASNGPIHDHVLRTLAMLRPN
jgi:3'(2'), 5'-bisphosphate nucleotidase